MSIKFHFFGKDCIINRVLSDHTNLELALQEKGVKFTSILFANQVHGAEVITIDSPEKIYGKQGLPKVDGLVTNLKNVVLAVITADCSPILLFDEEKKIIAAVHAGWRGAKLGVIQTAVEKMKKIGAKKIFAKIGPMIQQSSYEVSPDFFQDFLSESSNNKIFFAPSKNADKFLFDLPSYVEKKLKDAGISAIQNERVDTYKNEKEFFSFRRSKHLEEGDCGRNIAVVVIN